MRNHTCTSIVSPILFRASLTWNSTGTKFWGTNKQLTPTHIPEPWIRSMSHISEQSSEDDQSSQDTEYHSESGSELEKKQIIFISPNREFMFLNIQFPLPFNFPKLYLTLNKVVSNVDDALPKPYVREHSIAKNPFNALGYIITHFNIHEVSHSIWEFPRLELEQIYYSTYIDTSHYIKLQHLIMITGRNLQIQNALAQEWLDLQRKYARYNSSDNVSPYLSQCLL